DPTKPVTHTQILNYANSVAKDNPEFNQLLDVYNKSKEAYEEKVLFRKGVEERVKLRDKAGYEKLAGKKVTLSDGTVVSGVDFFSGMRNIRKTIPYAEGDKGYHIESAMDYTFDFSLNGKVYNNVTLYPNGKLATGDTKKIFDLFKTYQDYVSDNRKLLNEEYSKKWYEA